MKTLSIRIATVLVAAGVISGVFAVGTNTSLVVAQSQNSTSTQTQSASTAELVCEKAMNSTGTASSTGNQTTASASGAGANSTSMSSSSGSGGNTTVASDGSSPLMRSLLHAKMNLQEACMALQNDDSEAAFGFLIVVEKEVNNMEGNMTSTDTAGNATGTGTDGSSDGQNQTGSNNPFGGLTDLFGG